MVRGAVNVRAHEGKAYTDMRVDDIELLGGRKNEETKEAPSKPKITETADDLPF
jgi:hypothetical protein